ncbi:3-deoxy-7-phosphoheptulonate synthase [Proteinivorax hydrogeniformans]|uniref:3-deoxy-7-phosphoheptulonate synthase n=1 Tax=Proteinivorax hydrogeniformans TaxID=1826727 RepID=A0AAU8HWQ1_9FIRM
MLTKLEQQKLFPLASKDNTNKDTVIRVKDVQFGKEPIVIAGPCAVECEEQIDTIASFLHKNSVPVLRGGAYKPRTSPYSFQGLHEKGLQMLSAAGKKYNLVTVSEAVDEHSLKQVAHYCDIIQIGARNMFNYELLKKVGKFSKPVLLKRGMSATISEFLTAAEYIIKSGNKDVILCERGIRTFENYTRNTLDLSAVAAIRELSHLPVIVDPSHGSGRRSLVTPLAKASLAVGGQGLMIEIHNEPSKALSDGFQSLDFSTFKNLLLELKT